ncbi:MAG: ATP-binding cassette domain-containing protein [Alphaproteobacteria bacterium]|nr:ATP-binding cassette domain-containing protein [Alphaproteobacteria bacterium]
MRDIVLEVAGLRRFFTVKRGFPRTRTVTIRALDGISFTVREGEAFGLVGESGCGKSTAGRAVLRLVEPDEGRVAYKGEDVLAAGKEALRALRRKMQIIFQDPYASLNPRRMIGKALVEPMRVHGVGAAAEREERAAALLAEVGLPRNALSRYPHEFSGGQRQRIGIARSLTLEPELIVADEPVSALDVSIQSQILLLLQRLQERRRLAFIFISHDLGVVRYFCQSMAVMYLGRIVETGRIPGIFKEPLHPYTKMLRDASPVPDPTRKVAMLRIEGEVPSAVSPPAGCHFHTRCPHVMEVCRKIYPQWRQIDAERGVACHLHSAP